MSKQNQTEKPTQQKSQRGEESRKAYVKYSGMIYVMAGSVAMGVLIGQYLDEKYATERPYWTAGLSLLFLFVGMYSSLKDLLHPPKK